MADEGEKRSSSGEYSLQDDAGYQTEISVALESTERDAIAFASTASEVDLSAWQKARDVVQRFQPVPWFIWRLSNFVFNTKGKPNPITEGLVFGLRRVVLGAANDPILGKGEKVNDIRQALKTVSGDVIAAVSVIHSICRKLSSQKNERAWRPILDDALLRAHVGFFVGLVNPLFGSGRGMLAGFAGRCGLSILIATAEKEFAERALSGLALGKSLREVGIEVYGTDPLQVSAMALSASGCGKDAALGTVAYASRQDDPDISQLSEEQRKWLSAFTIVEAVRTSQSAEVSTEHWNRLGFAEEAEKEELHTLVKMLIRKGHGWGWMA